jgi:putative aminopeptidase FrvX
MLNALYAALPGLGSALDQHRYLTDSAALWRDLERLLKAHAPSAGSWLPGAITDDIGAIADSHGLGAHFSPHLKRTGNAALRLGAPGETADVIVVAHMDRPSFRPRDLGSGELYPMCSIRIPGEAYTCGAKALRFTEGRISVSARGTITLEKRNGTDSIRFSAESGELAHGDTVVMDVEPVLREGVITATGLDNCLGVMTALGAAAALAAVEPHLSAQGKRLLFVFSDQEEGIPDAFFGYGAARLTGIMPAPTVGMICVDGQTAGAHGGSPRMGYGAGFGTVSAWSRGSVVPPNYLALGVDLVAEANAAHPGCAQVNTGYLSRSDDMILSRWTQVLAMIGPPMANPHTVQETAYLRDLQHGIRWLTLYLTAVLGVEPGLTARYALAR